MPLVSFAQLFGLSGVTLGVVATWYQFQRARRVSVDGISLATWFQFMLMAAFWISYGFAVHSKMVVAGSVFVLPMQAAIVARLEPWRHWDRLGAISCVHWRMLSRADRTARLVRRRNRYRCRHGAQPVAANH